MSEIDLRARSASELVDAAFSLYRRDLMQYVMVTAVAYSPFIVVSLFLTSIPTPAVGAPPDMSLLYKLMPIALLSIFTFTMVGGVVSRMGSDVYLGGSADVARTIREIVPRFFSLLGSGFLVGLMSMFAFLLLFFPVLWVLAATFAVFPIVVLENKGPVAAIARSFALSRGRKGHILGTLLLVFGIYFVLSFGITIAASVFGNPIILSIVSAVYAIFAYPIVILVVMLLYYDARIRGEGFDVEFMAQSLSRPATAPMGGTVA